MDGPKILVPYNFTAYDRKALDFARRTFSHMPDSDITLFYAYTPAPNIEVNGNPVMDKLKGSMNYLAERIKEREKDLNAAVEDLVENGFDKSRVQAVFKPKKKDVAREIIDLAQDRNFNVIVMNHRPGRITQLFTGNVYQKVVSAVKDIAVCLVT
jgi:nucleotide-binding universal stress UspA family protein